MAPSCHSLSSPFVLSRIRARAIATPNQSTSPHHRADKSRLTIFEQLFSHWTSQRMVRRRTATPATTTANNSAAEAATEPGRCSRGQPRGVLHSGTITTITTKQTVAWMGEETRSGSRIMPHEPEAVMALGRLARGAGRSTSRQRSVAARTSSKLLPSCMGRVVVTLLGGQRRSRFSSCRERTLRGRRKRQWRRFWRQQRYVTRVQPLMCKHGADQSP